MIGTEEDQIEHQGTGSDQRRLRFTRRDQRHTLPRTTI